MTDLDAAMHRFQLSADTRDVVWELSRTTALSLEAAAEQVARLAAAARVTTRSLHDLAAQIDVYPSTVARMSAATVRFVRTL